MATLRLEFVARERRGVVSVHLSRNDDPVETGHHLVAADFEAEAFRDFPVVTAELTYDGTGPRAWFGWVQVVEAHGEAVVDATGEGDSPWYTFGYLPRFADAPANPHHPDGDWRATTFLAAVPDVIRSRRMVPLVGFTWGYRLRGGRPKDLFPPAAASCEDWTRLSTTVMAAFPSWELAVSREPNSG